MLNLAEALARTATDPPPPVSIDDLEDVVHLLEGTARHAATGIPVEGLPLRACKREQPQRWNIFRPPDTVRAT